MYEYGVALEDHINIPQDPARLFTLAIGLLGDAAVRPGTDQVTNALADESLKDLRFSARFFDAYLQTRLNESLNPYVTLLAASSYYLCDLPGSSSVLAQMLGTDAMDLGGSGLEDLLRWLLRGEVGTTVGTPTGVFGVLIVAIGNEVRQLVLLGSGLETVLTRCGELRTLAYSVGSPRELLLADLACAVIRKKCNNLSWRALPDYTDLTVQSWSGTLAKPSFMKELWPAQHLLGQSGVFRGKSAVVQMPTSAGKTRALEIVIRSAFLANRTSLAVIIAPFRALCHEIKNSLSIAFRNEPVRVDELSDVTQGDFDISELLGAKQIIVVTPEKFVYVLRHNPELAQQIGLVVFDEGHQFDSGTRGVTYELLLTTLKLMLPAHVQKVLISAVLSNAEALGNWLNGAGSEVISGTKLNPTFRTLGFASWTTALGKIDFVADDKPDSAEFFVPRVMEQLPLQRRPREKVRVFPEKTAGPDVALLLGLKLSRMGAVAIFCGRKTTAAKLCERVVDIFERGVALKSPGVHCDAAEVSKLAYLHAQNLGPEASATQCAALGIYSHHGNTPHGIRLSVEHAMRAGLIKFVICTSTLAQGVNLPIRYLVVTSLYQGPELIKVRDFHNLIGRAGRAGMHTEGSILFADTEIYDERNGGKQSWRWQQLKKLLEPANSEPCISSLLSFFDRLQSDDGKYKLAVDPLELFSRYIAAPTEISKFAESVATQHADKGFTVGGLRTQVIQRTSFIAAVESFLMSHWDTGDTPIAPEGILVLAQGTLAYHLADTETKAKLIRLFAAIGDHVAKTVLEPERRRIFGKTLYGVNASEEIEAWARSHVAELTAATGPDDILNTPWPLIVSHCHNSGFRKCDKPEALRQVALAWLAGRPFNEILQVLRAEGARIIWGTKFREFVIESVVDVCEGGLAFDGSLLVGAVTELLEYIDPTATAEVVLRLRNFQKRFKYGLSSPTECALYELGFADRALVRELRRSLGLTSEKRTDVVRQLREAGDALTAILNMYPAYFTYVWNEVLP
jgi:hypothetical protein